MKLQILLLVIMILSIGYPAFLAIMYHPEYTSHMMIREYWMFYAVGLASFGAIKFLAVRDKPNE